MKRVARALAACLLIAGTAATGTGTASAAGGCTHWQYKVKSAVKVYSVYGSQIGTAYRGYILNAPYFSANAQGTLYDENKKRVDLDYELGDHRAVINKDYLTYVRCW